MRISIFIDGNNLYRMSRDNLGWNIDLRKLISYYNAKGTVVDAYYYAAIDPEKGKTSFHKLLPYFGFVLISKPLKTFGSSPDSPKKGNLDIEIVLDIFNTIDNYDMAVLVSGDGDFLRPLELLRARGKQFEILSTRGVIAQELRDVAGMHYRDLVSMESILKYSESSKVHLEEIVLSEKDMVPIEEEYPV